MESIEAISFSGYRDEDMEEIPHSAAGEEDACEDKGYENEGEDGDVDEDEEML